MRWLRRVPTAMGVVLVLGSIPAATSAQTVEGFVGYSGSASGTSFTAFPTVPALLPVEVPFEATIGLATATLSSGGQGFGRASTFFPGTLVTGARQLIEQAAGTRLPLPDYPVVVEAREFEEAKHSEVPGLTMSTDVDPNRAIAVADVGSVGVPAVVGVRSIRTESKVVLEGDRITSTSTSTVSGVEIVGVLSIGSIVSKASVTSDGTTSTCSGGVVINDVNVAGTPATLDDTGLHVQGQALLPGLGLGALASQVLAGTGVEARALGGDSSCETAAGSRTTAGVLISVPLGELGAIPAGGGVHVVLGSTSASAGASILPPEDTAEPDSTPVLGDVVTRLPGPDIGSGPLSPFTPEPIPSGDGFVPEPVSYAFDGVPASMLIGLALFALVLSRSVRRYMRRITSLVS